MVIVLSFLIFILIKQLFIDVFITKNLKWYNFGENSSDVREMAHFMKLM